MRRILLAMMALAGVAGVAPAFGESCSPAMCASMSPACWDAYQKAVVAKNDKIGSVDKCRELAADLDGKGSFMKVPDLTEQGALCACEAVFWSLGGDAQGLPDIEDKTQERSNSADDDE
ncbi:hypothetical protein KF840_21280 [bacterium]|nr:hypothetical protein [bacterium]